MNDTGINTAAITKVIEMIAPEISFMASIEAVSALLYPWSSFAWTASTTTMASSTTMAIANSKAESTNRLIEKPNTFRKKKVPISDTGTAINGIKVERQSCKKIYTTKNTSSKVRIRVNTTSSILAYKNSVTS